ncbi:hypothetical protein GCM10007096_35920 [Pullulanibacillus pueri]|uniref:Uncharacterized protein n=1 Tax=Pullulanibacillus pueri TaxID=1437324 RepID=A0A8J2ZZ58_9BACL|nr:hypothetical protein GCM10007096_35920 [Pullulanibacillus pueri]
MFSNFLRKLFKRNEGNLVELISLFVGLLAVSLITSYCHLGRNNWYLIVPLLILVFIVYKVCELIIAFLFRNKNIKVNESFFVLAIVVIALINTFVIY